MQSVSIVCGYIQRGMLYIGSVYKTHDHIHLTQYPYIYIYILYYTQTSSLSKPGTLAACTDPAGG